MKILYMILLLGLAENAFSQDNKTEMRKMREAVMILEARLEMAERMLSDIQNEEPEDLVPAPILNQELGDNVQEPALIPPDSQYIAFSGTNNPVGRLARSLEYHNVNQQVSLYNFVQPPFVDLVNTNVNTNSGGYSVLVRHALDTAELKYANIDFSTIPDPTNAYDIILSYDGTNWGVLPAPGTNYVGLFRRGDGSVGWDFPRFHD